MIPEVSAGSNQVGARAKCTAHVIWPSGAATAGEAVSAPIRRMITAVKRPRTVLMADVSLLARSGPRDLRLCLHEPEPHVHLAVHRRRRGQMLLRFLSLAR